jgi:predicted dehydrogenase
MTLYFPEQVIAHINVNWLSPVKVRTTLIGGEKQMLVWNDLEADEKVKVYDKGVDITNREGVYELLVNYRSGDMWAPQLEQVEALREELSYFVDCISSGREPFNDGCAGLRVVKMLEAASESLSKRGALVPLLTRTTALRTTSSWGRTFGYQNLSICMDVRSETRLR